MSDSVRLNGVEETLMILLWARAIATQRGGLIDDPAAVELVERLEYDFKSKLGPRVIDDADAQGAGRALRRSGARVRR